MTKLHIFLLCIAIGACARADITPGSLRAAAGYSSARRGYSLLVMQHDKIIFEDYENGTGRGDTHKIYSGTKSFWVAAMLVAANQGLLTLDDRVSDTITEWRDDPRKRNITIRQLMNFTDGLDPAFALHQDRFPDRDAYAIRVPLVAKPGSAFTYGPSHGQVMVELLRRKLAAQGATPYKFLVRKVLDPIGIGPVEHKEDPAGNPLVATGFKLTARDWVRFGVLLLHNGTYHGREIIPAALMAECFHGTRVNPAFGLGLWLNREAAFPGSRDPDIEDTLEKKWQQEDWNNVCVAKGVPSDMFVALGSSYQRMYVIPSLDLIIVRQGENAKFSDPVFLRTLLGR
ncbi:MAG TPA: serine hydrolase [Chthoniobacteraceae bacterium]|nr:serine hydrolase [Chthoniobacteraceae bacterium]